MMEYQECYSTIVGLIYSLWMYKLEQTLLFKANFYLCHCDFNSYLVWLRYMMLSSCKKQQIKQWIKNFPSLDFFSCKILQWKISVLM